MKAKKHRNAVRLISLFLSIVTLPYLAIFGFAEEMQPSATSTSPKAYFFTYNNGSNFNSRATASNSVLTNLWSMGFSAGEYLNNYATTIFSVIRSKEVTVIAGKGFWCETALPGQSTTTRIFADEFFNDRYGDYSVEENDVVMSDLATMSASSKTSNLVIVASPFSGYIPSQEVLEDGTLHDYPSTITQMRSKVTKCALGWDSHLHANTPEMAEWMRLFFKGCNDGKTIQQATDYANEELEFLATDLSNDDFNDVYASEIYQHTIITGSRNIYIDD